MARNKPFFKSVDTKVNFPELERELLDYWENSGIVKIYLSKNKLAQKHFSFMDGPITANGPMGVHHGWGRTYKDLWQRFKNMQGYRQRFQNGFDAQGLWVEVEVEKELGFKNKKDIEEYGVAKFVQKCRDRVMKFSKMQTEQSKRLGYFMDWENSYYTMSDENNFMIWHFLKVVDDHGWLYKGHDSVPWCPRCETAISQHEMLTEDYKEVTHDSIFLALPIKSRNEYLIVWTTTPWTIPANIAVALNKTLDYVLVEHVGKRYWLAKETIGKVFGADKPKVVKTVKGSKLVGLKYSVPFDDLPAVKEVAKNNPDTFHTVVATDDKIMPVTTDEGTGLVHTAVSAGSEDYKLGQKLGLPMIPVIADNADYIEGLGFLTGKNAKKHPELIFDYLKSEEKKEGIGWVFEIRKYKHRYPGCWRCKTELVWKVTDEWYIAMDKPSKIKTVNKKSNLTLRERMMIVTKKIAWIPGFGLKRELDWLKNMHDWLISKKNRYWGLALPIWVCEKCENFEVIGGRTELKKRAVKGWESFEGKSPHKPQIDEIELKCSKCGGTAKRIEPVGSPWLDAGIVSYSTITKNNGGEPLYTSDKKEWRKWFPADFITESFPGQFKNWFYSMIAMSTVLENEEPYKTVLGFATLTGEDGRPMHKSWGNAVDFNEGADKIGVDVMRWMYVRQEPSSNLLFGYRVADEVRRQFHLKLWNIYNFFVTYANLDDWRPEKSKLRDQKLSLLDKWLLARLSKTVDSVTKSLEEFNSFAAASVLEKFVDDFSRWYIRRSRDRVGMGAGDGGDKNAFYSTTHYTFINLAKLLAPFIPYMSDVIYTNLTKSRSVHLEDWPEVEKAHLNPELEKSMDRVRVVVEKAHASRKMADIPVRYPLNSLSTVEAEPQEHAADLAELVKAEVNVKRVIWGKKDDLDLSKTPELEEEAKTRELVRNIQVERKNMGIELTQKVVVSSSWLPKSGDNKQYLKRKTLTTKLTKGKFKVTKA